MKERVVLRKYYLISRLHAFPNVTTNNRPTDGGFASTAATSDHRTARHRSIADLRLQLDRVSANTAEA